MIILSGHSLQQEAESLKRVGVATWLKKPPNLDQLARAVAQALRPEPPKMSDKRAALG